MRFSCLMNKLPRLDEKICRPLSNPWRPLKSCSVWIRPIQHGRRWKRCLKPIVHFLEVQASWRLPPSPSRLHHQTREMWWGNRCRQLRGESWREEIEIVILRGIETEQLILFDEAVDSDGFIPPWLRLIKHHPCTDGLWCYVHTDGCTSRLQ